MSKASSVVASVTRQYRHRVPQFRTEYYLGNVRKRSIQWIYCHLHYTILHTRNISGKEAARASNRL